jgi:hypothetical protein
MRSQAAARAAYNKKRKLRKIHSEVAWVAITCAWLRALIPSSYARRDLRVIRPVSTFTAALEKQSRRPAPQHQELSDAFRCIHHKVRKRMYYDTRARTIFFFMELPITTVTGTCPLLTWTLPRLRKHNNEGECWENIYYHILYTLFTYWSEGIHTNITQGIILREPW